MNAPPLPFLFQLRTLSSPTFYQQFVSTINLPFRHFLSLSSSHPLCLSSILPTSYPFFFFSSLSFPYNDLFFRFSVMSRVLLSLFLTFSFYFLISQRHLRTFRGVCTFPSLFLFCFFIFSMLVLLCPSFISLSPCLAPPKRRI